MNLVDIIGADLAGKLSSMGYEEREYQTEAAIALFTALRNQQNALLELPPGLGKTLIALLVIGQWHQATEKAKTLVIVPTTLLVEQHFRAATWLKSVVTCGRVTSEIAAKASRLRYLVTSSAMVVTTPLVLRNAMKNGAIPWDFLDSISLCVIDEYDEFTKSDGGALRLHSYLEPLHGLMERSGVPILGLSAASPTTDPKACYWANRLEATVCTPSGNGVNPYLPLLNVHFLPVHDPVLVDNDQKISDRISHSLRETEGLLGRQLGCDVFVDLNRLIPVLSSIASGRTRRLQVRTANGTVSTSINYQVIRCIQHIQQCLHERLLLFEDMTGAVSVDKSFKAQMLFDLVQARSTDLGLLMVRYIDLGHAVATALQSQGVNTSIVHGQLGTAQREQNLNRILDDPSGALVMTRRLGGRGFDFPQADYAVFYSPKQEEAVMWQELLRFRSSRRTTKDAYILYYAGTVERDKASRLCEAMQRVAEKGYHIVTTPT
jgi:ERCC4-related helicase